MKERLSVSICCGSYFLLNSHANRSVRVMPYFCDMVGMVSLEVSIHPLIHSFIYSFI